MSFAKLRRRLRFLPLGLLWGVVGGGFHTYVFVHITDGPPPQFGPTVIGILILVTIIMMLGTCPIATLFGSALLKRDLAARRWIVNWVITAFASSAVGVVIFWLMLLVLGTLWAAAQHVPLFSNSTSTVERLVLVLLTFLLFPTGLGILIGFATGLVALMLAPLALLGRRLILRRASVAEPVIGASRTQP